MKLRALLMIVTLLGGGSCAAATVYDAISGGAFAGGIGGQLIEAGQAITLAGTARQVVLFEALMRDEGEESVTVGASFYHPDGPGGQPGTRIWAGERQTFQLAPAPTVLTFPVPGIVVPDTFIWVLDFAALGFDAVIVNTALPNPGTHGTRWFSGPGNVWQTSTVIAALGARVTAVPLPAMTGALLLSLTFCVGYRRRNRLPRVSSGVPRHRE